MSFDPIWLFWSLIPSGIGFVLFVYGKKQQRLPQLVAGLAFMIYPIFTTTLVSMSIVGALLGAGLFWAIKEGF